MKVCNAVATGDDRINYQRPAAAFPVDPLVRNRTSAVRKKPRCESIVERAGSRRDGWSAQHQRAKVFSNGSRLGLFFGAAPTLVRRPPRRRPSSAC